MKSKLCVCSISSKNCSELKVEMNLKSNWKAAFATAMATTHIQLYIHTHMHVVNSDIRAQDMRHPTAAPLMAAFGGKFMATAIILCLPFICWTRA